MEILKFTVISIVILFAITKYIQQTTEQALSKRWKFVDFMKTILKSDDYSPEFKIIILSMFNYSMDRQLLPKLLLFVSFMKIFRAKEYKKIEVDFKNGILGDSKQQHEQYQKAIILMLEVNLYNAPHWYVIIGFLPVFLIVIFSVFAKANKLLTKTLLETSVFTVVRP